MKIIKLHYIKEQFPTPLKIMEWGSWILLNLIAFIGSSVLWDLTRNGFAWMLGGSILILALIYGEAMRHKGAQEELEEVEEENGLSGESQPDKFWYDKHDRGIDAH